MAFQLTSAAFEANGTIPREYTCDGADLSPPLRWAEPPAGTKSFALICDDPDAPRGTWVHWVLFNLPASTTSLSTGLVPSGARQGTTDFGRPGYGGPCPPRGPAHRYVFTLYALDLELDLPAGAAKAALLRAMDGHILAQTELIGRYQR